MIGRPFFLFERVDNFGPYGNLTTGLSMGDPRMQSLDAKTCRIVASSHDGMTVMFWNGYEPESEVQWEGNVNTGGEPVYGPTGALVTLEAVLNQVAWYWEDSRVELEAINEEMGEQVTAAQILEAMSNSDTLAERVLSLLNQGMWDEWDTSLCHGIDAGFGGAELRIAARTAHFIETQGV